MEQKRNIIGNQSLSQGQPRVLKGATRTEDDIGFASKIDRQSRKLASASWSPSSFSMLSQGIDKNWNRPSHETSQIPTLGHRHHIVAIGIISFLKVALDLVLASSWYSCLSICINWYPIYQYYQFEIDGRRSVCFPVKGDSHPPQ